MFVCICVIFMLSSGIYGYSIICNFYIPYITVVFCHCKIYFSFSLS
ncbi:Hypothetical protein EUBREC_2201 [Agathobacter rectalis ATCC 33656]|uniref:Uncharacterized protein n=1 Tax=Agathobacter rectalis (strain ATCC 33656 / DSM 3377 / JCM 17463 / KCTC 5835 / VPI 0990) TaxID=515619 RepID=C4ZCX8_AGARV|nr:Hypothetical protein EUBREC_2201 [Agathobacter rectalis ATCC 33656]